MTRTALDESGLAPEEISELEQVGSVIADCEGLAVHTNVCTIVTAKTLRAAEKESSCQRAVECLSYPGLADARRNASRRQRSRDG